MYTLYVLYNRGGKGEKYPETEVESCSVHNWSILILFLHNIPWFFVMSYHRWGVCVSLNALDEAPRPQCWYSQFKDPAAVIAMKAWLLIAIMVSCCYLSQVRCWCWCWLCLNAPALRLNPPLPPPYPASSSSSSEQTDVWESAHSAARAAKTTRGPGGLSASSFQGGFALRTTIQYPSLPTSFPLPGRCT